MIYTITLNPAIDRLLFIQGELEKGRLIESKKRNLIAGERGFMFRECYPNSVLKMKHLELRDRTISTNYMPF